MIIIQLDLNKYKPDEVQQIYEQIQHILKDKDIIIIPMYCNLIEMDKTSVNQWYKQLGEIIGEINEKSIND